MGIRCKRPTGTFTRKTCFIAETGGSGLVRFPQSKLSLGFPPFTARQKDGAGCFAVCGRRQGALPLDPTSLLRKPPRKLLHQGAVAKLQQPLFVLYDLFSGSCIICFCKNRCIQRIQLKSLTCMVVGESISIDLKHTAGISCQQLVCSSRT